MHWASCTSRFGIFGGVCHLPRFTKHTNLRTPFESEAFIHTSLGLRNLEVHAHLPASTIWIINCTDSSLPPTPWHVGARNVAPGYHIRLQPLLNSTMHKRRYKFIVRYLDKKSNNASHQKFP